jgi:hypothetical protein
VRTWASSSTRLLQIVSAFHRKRSSVTLLGAIFRNSEMNVRPLSGTPPRRLIVRKEGECYSLKAGDPVSTAVFPHEAGVDLSEAWSSRHGQAEPLISAPVDPRCKRPHRPICGAGNEQHRTDQRNA